MYFIERHYLYTKIVSSGRGVETSEKGTTGAPCGMPVYVRRALVKGSAEGALVGGRVFLYFHYNFD